MAAPTDQNNNPFAYKPVIEKKKGKSVSNTKPALIIILVIVVIALAIGGYLYYLKDQEVQKLSNIAGTQDLIEYQEILVNVKKLVSISDNETVRIALIDDVSKLIEQNPSFYKNAEVGQYLVIMPTSQRVLIYDKAENKIVNFSSYSIKVDVIAESEIPASEKPFTIEIRYEEGVSQETIQGVKDALTKASTSYSIIATSQTTKTTYESVTLVLLNRNAKPKMSQNIIAHTGTSSILESLPTDEASSTADAVLILAK